MISIRFSPGFIAPNRGPCPSNAEDYMVWRALKDEDDAMRAAGLARCNAMNEAERKREMASNARLNAKIAEIRRPSWLGRLFGA